MNRKLVFLNILLVVLAISLCWIVRVRWMDSQARQRALLAQKIPPKNVFAPPSPPPVKPVAPSEYIDVAQKMLFSKDRNPTVVIEAPPPKPETPMPALPQYYGQMAIGDPILFLGIVGGAQSGLQKSYRAGDQIGDFKLIAFDRDTIALEWHGKKIERRLDELKPKEPLPQAAAPAVAASTAPSGAPAATATVGVIQKPVTALSPASASPGQVVDPKLGPDVGNGQRQCVDGDSSPPGTVVSGYKKTIIPFMFGQICRWEPTK